MSAQHTPGPWHAVGQVVKSGAANVAHVTQMNGDSPELVAANARLIAAAPELLDALRKLMTICIEQDILDEDDDGPSYSPPGYDDALAEAALAVTKAVVAL